MNQIVVKCLGFLVPTRIKLHQWKKRHKVDEQEEDEDVKIHLT